MDNVRTLTSGEKRGRTIAAKRQREAEQRLRDHIVAMGRDEWIASFEIAWGETVGSVVVDILKSFGDASAHAVDPAFGYGGDDVAIWHERKLVAVERRGPIATVF